jgi:hypothetical protein
MREQANPQQFTNCLFEAFKIPLERFKRRGDGRQWKHSAHARQTLFQQLASFGNADGTSIRPAITTLMERTGWSHGKVCYVLDDLQRLGFMERTGRFGQRGSAIRKLAVPPEKKTKIRTNRKQEPAASNLRSESPIFDSQNPNVISESPNLISQSPTAIGHDLPSSDLPSKPANQPAPTKSGLVGRLGVAFAKTTGKGLNKNAGRKELLALAELKGDECIKTVWAHWVKTRNLEGMDCPFVHFVNEFEETEALIQTETDKKTAKQNAHDSECKVQQWKDGLAATTDIATYLATIPAPEWIAESEGQIYRLSYLDEAIADEQNRRVKRERRTQEDKHQAVTADEI